MMWHFDILFEQVFYKLIRRYKYLEKAFEDDLRKASLALFLVFFSHACSPCRLYLLVYDLRSTFDLIFLRDLNLNYVCLADPSFPKRIQGRGAPQASHRNRSDPCKWPGLTSCSGSLIWRPSGEGRSASTEFILSLHFLTWTKCLFL